MLPEYELTGARPNPYAKRARRSVTLNMDVAVVDYFKALAQQSGIPYQKLINLNLIDCDEEKRTPKISWGA